MPENYDLHVFLELFLTPSEKDHFASWREIVTDRSFINPISAPIFEWLAQFVPSNVAPNVLTLSGSVMILQAWYFCELYSRSQPLVVVIASYISIWVFWLFGGIDGRHAKRIMNDSSLGELFKYVCDLISSVFLVVVLCELCSSSTLTHNGIACRQFSWCCLLSITRRSCVKQVSGTSSWVLGS